MLCFFFRAYTSSSQTNASDQSKSSNVASSDRSPHKYDRSYFNAAVGQICRLNRVSSTRLLADVWLVAVVAVGLVAAVPVIVQLKNQSRGTA